MDMSGYIFRLLLLAVCPVVFKSTEVAAVLSGSKHCAACRAIISDADWAIQQVDPKKRVQVGNYRIDAKGNQKVKEKNYARSETHLTEIFEDICEKMTDYAEMTNEDGTKQIVRVKSPDGKMLKTRHLDLERDIGGTLKYRCLDFLEDNEEEVMSLLQRSDIPNYETVICVEETGACTLDEIAHELVVLPEVTFGSFSSESSKDDPDDDEGGDEEEEEEEDENEEEGDQYEEDKENEVEEESEGIENIKLKLKDEF